MRGIPALMLTVALFGWPAVAPAVPVVSVDMNPGVAGVQTTFSVPRGHQLTVHIVVSQIDASSPLNGFTFDLVYTPAILNPTGVSDGGFLLPTVFVSEMDLLAPDVNFTETTLGPGGAYGDGILAAITFDAVETGFSLLSLNDVQLSAPGGAEIPLGQINVGGAIVIPEPGGLTLVGTGLAALAGWTRRRFR